MAISYGVAIEQMGYPVYILNGISFLALSVRRYVTNT